MLSRVALVRPGPRRLDRTVSRRRARGGQSHRTGLDAPRRICLPECSLRNARSETGASPVRAEGVPQRADPFHCEPDPNASHGCSASSARSSHAALAWLVAIGLGAAWRRRGWLRRGAERGPRELPDPKPGAGQVLLRVSACACRSAPAERGERGRRGAAVLRGPSRGEPDPRSAAGAGLIVSQRLVVAAQPPQPPRLADRQHAPVGHVEVEPL